MTLDAKTLAKIAVAVAGAPKLTPEQISELRRILRPDEMLIPRMPGLARSTDPAPLRRAA